MYFCNKKYYLFITLLLCLHYELIMHYVIKCLSWGMFVRRSTRYHAGVLLVHYSMTTFYAARSQYYKAVSREDCACVFLLTGFLCFIYEWYMLLLACCILLIEERKWVNCPIVNCNFILICHLPILEWTNLCYCV